ncbi:aminopeptidase [Pontibacillus halophilus JSM 076056 = DSM 19796]|uniref:Aminopeptidase n=1 Tax=Pontibacillus halophilus JSM 076056 = DSM 19796 TaxID=1385510 RepID=A0A0A5GCF1_9BACI|nr:M42 family metallopeptidase [Pontibacillus halophilus]KGX90866.1 aminopeptidase [Pontibacillus halophilus JSM 076056 = DSM 19796]
MNHPVAHTSEIVAILKDLVHIPSPSGYTEEAIQYCERHFEELGVATRRTNKGALLATIEGKREDKHRLLTAHVDTLGAMVKAIKPSGALQLSMIGGFKWNSVEGEYCSVHTANGSTISGTILMHQTSVHVYKGAGDAKRNEDNMEVRLDAEVHSEKDVRDLGIEVGDFVSFQPRFDLTETGFIKSRHLDDKASVALLLHAASELSSNEQTPPVTTHFLISNNEEIGYGGNSSIPSETVEYVAVDMGAIGDGQSTTEFVASICAKDGSGPYHYGLRQQLVQLARHHLIEYAVDIYPYYASDASAAIRAGVDVKHGLIGPGIDASHALERTHEKSLKHTYHLIMAYLMDEMRD